VRVSIHRDNRRFPGAGVARHTLTEEKWARYRLVDYLMLLQRTGFP
jgi:hypothetical protein